MKCTRLLTVGLMALFCVGTATAASQLNSVQVTPAATAATVNLRTTGSYVHKEYRPDEHLMLVDLTGVTAAPAVAHTAAVNSAALKGYKLSTYTSASGSEVTRVELELGEGVTANVNDESDGLKIQLSSGASTIPASPALHASVAAALASSPALSAAPKPTLAETANPPRPAPAPLGSLAKDVTKDATKDATKNPAAPQTAHLIPLAPPSVHAPAPASQPHPAATALAPATIRNVSVRQGQGSMDVVIEGPNAARSFLLKDPDRLVLDFTNAVLKPSVKNIAVHTKDVLQVRVGRFQAEPPTIRLVIDLSGPRAFEVVPSDKQVLVRVQTGVAAMLSPPPAAPSPVLASAVVPAAAGRTSLGSNNDLGVHAALASASFTHPVSASPVPAPSNTSQLRDQQISAIKPPAAEPKAQTAAPAAPSPRPAPPAVEMARLNPPAPPQPAAVAVPKPAPVGPSQALDPQASEPNAPAVAPAAPSPKPAPPAVELARLNPPALPQPAAVAVPKPASVGPSQPPDQQASEPKAQAAAPAAPSPKPAQPAVEMARLNPPAPPQFPPTPAPSLTPAPSSPSATAVAGKYTGEPISVNLKDVDLKDFFRLIHEISGLNIVLDPTVRGSVTLVLDDVPWDQALDIVLKNNALDRELQGNVLRIAATDTLRKEAVDRRAQSEAVALAVDRQTITRFLSYAKAVQIVPTIKKFITARGDVISDDRTNALIISDIPSVLPTLDRLISQLDRKSQEVEIEVRVVSATRSFSRDLGFQLGFNWGNGTTLIGGANPNASTLPSITTPSGVSSAVPLFSNFPAAGPSTGFSFSNITATYGIDAVLTAAETHNLAKVLSRPRIVTQSNVRAEVKQGVKLPVYTQATGTANASVSYIDAVLRLSVTPQITSDNTIFLTVDVENTQPSGTTGQGNYILTTQQTTTQVLVTDGGTVVIGGVIQTTNSVSTTQTPVLGNIPWLGNLFKERLVKTETDELIFFITPKIVQT
jgi:type IV pilus assembly protein PilQ